MMMLMMTTAIPGCAGNGERAPGAVDDLDRPPADFTLDVTILVGRRVPPQTEVERRQGHTILMSDGSLLHESGRSVDWNQRPGRTRMLYQQQVSDLWRIARELGFTNPANADFRGNPVLLQPERDETIYILDFRADGERWTFVRTFRGEEEPDPACVRLIRALADLSWTSDLSTERLRPIRYDFGPDPYAGFRRRSAP